MQHLTNVPSHGSLKELAKAVGDLRYDALEDFLYELQQKLYNDSRADQLRGRSKLSQSLANSADMLAYVRTHVSTAWKISAPFMNEKVSKKERETDQLFEKLGELLEQAKEVQLSESFWKKLWKDRRKEAKEHARKHL